MAAISPAATGTSDGGSAASYTKNSFDVCNEIVKNLKQSGKLEEEFCSGLLKHFDKFSHRYHQNTKNRFDDLLRHKRCLESAQVAPQRPIIDVNRIQANDEVTEIATNPVIRITIAISNKPNFYNEVIKVFVALGLEFIETYAYHTDDRCDLCVFVLSGCQYEVEHLKRTLENELSKFEISNVIAPPQHVVIQVGQGNKIGCIRRWLGWTYPEMLLFGVVCLVAFACLVCGIGLIFGASLDGWAVKYPAAIGQAAGNGVKLEAKDVGSALLYVVVPVLGTISVFLLVVEAIYKSLLAVPAVAIIGWLLICLALDCMLPFVTVKDSSIKDKAMGILAALVAVLATATNFYRRR